MIPRRHLDPDIASALRQLRSGISLQDLISHFILVALERNQGNRTRTSSELRIPLRTFRHRLRNIESLGFELTPPNFKQGETS